jgi:uncharacterized protein with gpF-like domain
VNVKYVGMNESVDHKLTEINDSIDKKLAKVTENVSCRLSEMNENLSKKVEDQAKIVFNKELVTFKETVLRENQSNLNENVKLARKTNEARINDLVSSVAKIQERLNVNSCYQSSSFSANGQGFSRTSPAENVGVVSSVAQCSES